MDLMNWIFSLLLILIDDFFGQPCRTCVFSEYLIYIWVIIQKSVFRTLYDSYKFLVKPFRVIDAQHSEPIIISILYFITISLSGFHYNILAYFLNDREHAENLVILL